MHQPFTVYKRKTTRKRKYVYYVLFRDEDGKRLSGKSSGKHSRAEATEWARKQLNPTLYTYSAITFGKYAENWFIWGKCEYLKRKLRRREYSRSYAEGQRGLLENLILPYFKHKLLSEITLYDIEEWLFSVKEKLSAASANRSLTVLKIIFKEALRTGKISRNPAADIEKLPEPIVHKGILSAEEVKNLFLPDSLHSIWKGNLIHFTLNLLAVTTGMRMGEVLALQVSDFHYDYIEVNHSWDRKYGLKAPKANSYRMVSLPQITSQCFNQLLAKDKYQDPSTIVFHGTSLKRAIDHKAVLKYFYRALNESGIDEEERLKRNITFHSHRHFFNTFMRGRIADSELQKLTGHRTQKMTEHYDHQQIESFDNIRKVQDQILNQS